MPSGTRNLLRIRDGKEAHVTNEELFFDLIYAFAVTQLSHRLLEDLSLLNALQTLVLWFGVWLGWQYTCWVTNWFDPERLAMRIMLFVVMLLGLVIAAAIPEAFGDRGMVFAGCYAAIQVGRSLFALVSLGRRHVLTPNFLRILGWVSIAAAFWIAGGLADGNARIALWIAAVACEYLSPMTGFWLPGLGRSSTRDWTIEGAHMAERCQLFVIMALGESVLVSGATLSHFSAWEIPTLISVHVAFLISIAMWWLYFDTSSKEGSEAIAHSSDPGRMGAYFHYVHVILIAGVIVIAVGNEMIIDHPDGHIDMPAMAVLIFGPLIYLLGNAVYKRLVYGRVPLSHLAGAAALCMLAGLAFVTDRLMVGGLVALILLGVAVWEGCARRASRKH